MPKIFGNPGNYALAESRRKSLRFFFIIIIAIAIICYLAGIATGLSLDHDVSLSMLAFILPMTFVFLARKRITRILDELQASGIAFRRGAEGEAITADALTDLPDTYSVFHDVTHPSINGNIDHIVVGPTGVFTLETKDWRGGVTLSGQGTLTVDGKHDHTRDAKAILGRSRELKVKIEALSNISIFVQAVMVFPKASVDVLPETRSPLAVHRLDRLGDYLTKPAPARQLTPQQVDTITRDLQALFKPAAQ